MLTPINSDEQIIQMAKNGNEQAIPAILEKYGDSLYGIAFHKLQSESLASEVIKQTFVTFWQQLSDFDEQPEKLFNSLFKIMHQIIVDKYLQKAA